MKIQIYKAKDEIEQTFLDGLSEDDLTEMLRDHVFDYEITVAVVDGCYVEFDGICPHGYRSPLVMFGMI